MGLVSETYNVDCMEYMRSLPDNFADIALVDPPYGIDLANMNMGAGKSKKASKIQNRKWVAKDWDKSTPDKEYFKELFRVSKNQLIFGGNYFELPPCYGYVIWDKEIPNGLSFADCEFIWSSFKYSAKICRYSAYLDKAGKFHPTQKPTYIYTWLLQKFAKAGDKILDTHLGSGSSRIAAYDLGFDFYSTELDTEYFNKQEARFATHIAQTKLFTPAQLSAEQTHLF